MNSLRLVAWMDDWNMSARLAKLSTLHSYELKFIEDTLELSNPGTQALFIIDMDSVDEEKFQSVQHLKDDKTVFILGYARKLDSSQVAHFRELGYDMVLRRNKLLMNMGPIIKKITDAGWITKEKMSTYVQDYFYS